MIRKPFIKKQVKREHNLNNEIQYPQVRLVGDNVENKIYDIREAKRIAHEMEMDLVEITNKVEPPICKIVDYKKFLYDKKKKEKETAQNQPKNKLKEIKLTPVTDENDFNFKLKNAIKFLEKKNKVKVTIFFKGRMIMYKQAGEEMVLRFTDGLSQYGIPEHLPKLEGKNMSIIIRPK